MHRLPSYVVLLTSLALALFQSAFLFADEKASPTKEASEGEPAPEQLFGVRFSRIVCITDPCPQYELLYYLDRPSDRVRRVHLEGLNADRMGISEGEVVLVRGVGVGQTQEALQVQVTSVESVGATTDGGGAQGIASNDKKDQTPALGQTKLKAVMDKKPLEYDIYKVSEFRKISEIFTTSRLREQVDILGIAQGAAIDVDKNDFEAQILLPLELQLPTICHRYEGIASVKTPRGYVIRALAIDYGIGQNCADHKPEPVSRSVRVDIGNAFVIDNELRTKSRYEIGVEIKDAQDQTAGRFRISLNKDGRVSVEKIK